MNKLSSILLILLSCATFTLAVGGITGCKTEHLPAATQARLAELEAEAQAVAAELEAARAAGDVEAAQAASARLAVIEEQIAQAIAEGAGNNVSSLFDLFGLSAFPGGPLVENVATALAWLAFPRPRRLLGKFLKGLNPNDKSVTAAEGLKAIPAALGLVHSTDKSAKALAAEGKA